MFEGARGGTRAAIKIYRPNPAARTDRNDREEHAQRQIAHACGARVLDTQRMADGSFVLEVPYSDPRELLMDVLRHGAEVEVLAPAPLREAMQRSIADMQARYAGSKPPGPRKS